VPAALQLFKQEGPLCGGCPWRSECGAMLDDKACRSKWRAKREGGGQVLHPAQPITKDFIASVGGPSLGDAVGTPVRVPTLPSYLPQIRVRRALRGHLGDRAYAVTAGTVIGTRSRMLTAEEIRENVGLHEDQLLVLLLFGKDEFLERLWDQRETFLVQLAAGGFDLITSPSYSLWEPRPRPEHLYAMKRSHLVFSILRELGAPVVPRLGWAIEHDVARLAAWANANPTSTHFAIDLTTYRGESAYAEQLEFLRSFDRETGSRHHFLINGPSRFDRVLRLFEAVEPDRISISNARAIARDSAPGTSFAEKVETERSVIRAARRILLANACPRDERWRRPHPRLVPR
jgi:hypothetical protein